MKDIVEHFVMYCREKIRNSMEEEINHAIKHIIAYVLFFVAFIIASIGIVVLLGNFVPYAEYGLHIFLYALLYVIIGLIIK